MTKLWGGRFTGNTNQLVESFTASHEVDGRLYREDIALNTAYSKALLSVGVITPAEQLKIQNGLAEVQKDIESGEVSFKDSLEDIHTHIEYWLTAKIGEPAKKLHTGKSRNDQVATDLRLYLMRVLLELSGQLESTIQCFETHLCLPDKILPGYTHLQKAQPVTLALHFGAYVEMFKRDIERIADTLKRVKIMPLGSGALSGNPFLSDKVRLELAYNLGFDSVSENSMDAVADRDFVVETLSALSLIMAHLSRLGEELVLWSTDEFGYLKISDEFTTGSSLMPQKKNPDVAELIRGKTGRVFGSLHAMLVTIKGLPLTYNRDLQEDKELLFDALDTVSNSLQILCAMIPGIVFDFDRMKTNSGGFILATKLADYLVSKGVPFREAHGVVGQVVTYCMANEKTEFAQLNVEEFAQFSNKFEEDVYKWLTI